MRTTQHKEKLTFDFSADAASLLDQMDAQLPQGVMANAAVCSAGLFEFAADQPAAYQASMVGHMSVSVVRAADPDSPDALALAVGAAALLMSAKIGPSTASERIRCAAGILSDRYQSDW